MEEIMRKIAPWNQNVRSFIKEYMLDIDSVERPEAFRKTYENGDFRHAYGDCRGLYSQGSLFTPPPRESNFPDFRENFEKDFIWFYDQIINLVKNHPKAKRFSKGCGGTYECNEELGKKIAYVSVHTQEARCFYYDGKVIRVLEFIGDINRYSKGVELELKTVFDNMYPYGDGPTKARPLSK